MHSPFTITTCYRFQGVVTTRTGAVVASVNVIIICQQRKSAAHKKAVTCNPKQHCMTLVTGAIINSAHVNNHPLAFASASEEVHTYIRQADVTKYNHIYSEQMKPELKNLKIE